MNFSYKISATGLFTVFFFLQWMQLFHDKHQQLSEQNSKYENSAGGHNCMFKLKLV